MASGNQSSGVSCDRSDVHFEKRVKITNNVHEEGRVRNKVNDAFCGTINFDGFNLNANM